MFELEEVVEGFTVVRIAESCVDVTNGSSLVVGLEDDEKIRGER